MRITIGKDVDIDDPALQKYRNAGYEIVKSERASESNDRVFKLLVEASKGEENE